jgi:hypothetical protein
MIANPHPTVFSREGADPSVDDAPTQARAPVFETIESAAEKLSVRPSALRSRCRRAAKRVGDASVVKLGGGIVAFKFGKTWRVRFPPA